MEKLVGCNYDFMYWDAQWEDLTPEELPEAFRHAQERFWRLVNNFGLERSCMVPICDNLKHLRWSWTVK